MANLGLVILASVVLLAAATTVPVNNVTLATRACQPPHDTYGFCDTSKSIDERVQDLISRLNDDEIPPLLTAREGGGGSPGPPGNISRLGLPEYDWGMNAIHGVQSSCVSQDGTTYCPTSFPNPVNYGFTWNKTAYYELGRVIGVETRALWLAGAVEASTWSGRPHIGLDTWSPNININRSPLWGRNQETPGESPYLNGQFGKLYTVGLQQGADDSYMQAVVTLKHWDAYSLENSDGYTRHNFDAKVSNFSLADTYWPAFEACVKDGKAAGVMCSYNAVNGIPTCAHPLLKHVLRTKWQFDGYVTSDTGAVADIFTEHKYVATGEQAVGVALGQGMTDIDSGKVYSEHLLQALADGNTTRADVNKALYNTLKLRFRLGLFDPIDNQAYWKVPLSEINTEESKSADLLHTLESMVLLKNDKDTLPFATGKKTVVIGPHAKAQAAMAGNYLGQLCPADNFDCITSPFDAMATINGADLVTYSKGCDLTSGSSSDRDAAVQAAKDADQVVLLLGIDQSIEGESHDRTNISLPEIQSQLAAAVIDVGKPTVIVLLNGGMLAIEAEQRSAPAIVEAGYPGFYGGVAIAQTVFGQNDHLGGKLSYTVYPADYITQIKMSDMELTTGPGRTFRYYTGEPLWSFGFGLSFTSFSFTEADKPSVTTFATGSNTTIEFSVKVTNTGSKAGDDVVQVYIAPQNLTQRQHPLIKKLVDFKRIHLQASASTIATFTVSSSVLQLVATESGNTVSTPGVFNLILSNGVDQSLSYPLTVTGDEVVVDPFPIV
eukprot:m.131922 g.131922  ORF g.131922 m.131922 type:complete len:777 (-) comp15917_c0_seq1:291-2621(-)